MVDTESKDATILYMTPIEKEIRECYERMGWELAEKRPLYDGFCALSQYGYVLQDGFAGLTQAEEYVIEYYSSRMNLIRQ